MKRPTLMYLDLTHEAIDKLQQAVDPKELKFMRLRNFTHLGPCADMVLIHVPRDMNEAELERFNYWVNTGPRTRLSPGSADNLIFL